MLGILRPVIFFSILLTVGAITYEYEYETLPVFTVQAHEGSSRETLQLATNLFGPGNYSITRSNGRYIAFSEDGTKRVEYDFASGAIWAADESELWNTEGPAPDLPADDEAIRMADDLVTKYSLLPQEQGPVIVSSGYISGTFLAHEYRDESGGYRREDYPLDVTVNYDITLSIADPHTHKDLVIVGGGGRFRVTFGNCGKLIAFQGLWREIVGVTYYPTTPQAGADQEYLASLGHLNGTADFDTSLVYFSQPAGNVQTHLYPVYLFNATIEVGEEVVELRPAVSRGKDYTSTGNSGSAPKRRSLDQRGALHARDSKDDKRLEAATEWLGEPYGLRMSEQNAAGFRSGLLGATPTWSINYDRSNENVWESDFTTDDDNYADSVDFLFYTGHANMNGWMANMPGTTTGVQQWVEYSSFGTTPGDPGDLIGQQDLEWLVIAACGPHQDQSFNPAAGNVFNRWRGIFDGLHIMFAYGTESYDTVEEGARLTGYGREGYRLIDAWLRTAKEAQPSGVIATVMWTAGPGGNARNDHLAGYGWVSEDNHGGSQDRWFMWTSC